MNHVLKKEIAEFKLLGPTQRTRPWLRASCSLTSGSGDKGISLLAVVGRTHENSLYGITGWVDGNEIAAFFSANELAYFSCENPTEAQWIDFSWRSEAVVPLIWALCGLEDFPALNSQFDIWENEMVRVALKAPGSFIASAELRDSNAIETQEQKLYQEHWRVRDAQLLGREMPPDLEPRIVYERRYALSWLVGW